MGLCRLSETIHLSTSRGKETILMSRSSQICNSGSVFSDVTLSLPGNDLQHRHFATVRHRRWQLPAKIVASLFRIYNKLNSLLEMKEFVGKAAVVLPALVGLYVVRRVVRKMFEDYVDR